MVKLVILFIKIHLLIIVSIIMKLQEIFYHLIQVLLGIDAHIKKIVF